MKLNLTPSIASNVGIALFILLTTGRASEIVITFEETDAGLHTSFNASITLENLSLLEQGTALSSVFEGLPTEMVGRPIRVSYASAATEDPVDLFDTGFISSGGFLPDLENFSSMNATNTTGDNFGFSRSGTDFTFLSFSLPTDYVSGTPLSGASTFPDLTMSDIEGILGTFALDSANEHTITFQKSPEVQPIEILAFDFNLAAQNATLSFHSQANTRYRLISSSNLDFENGNRITPLSANPGTIDNNEIVTDENGTATINFQLPTQKRAFFRIESATY